MRDLDDGFYDREGKPISRDEWGRLKHSGLDPDGHYGENSYLRIGERHFDDGVWVSTVWLGMDHGFGYGPPVIFETMVFGGEHDNELMRYCTEQDAVEGHAKTCADIEAGRPLWWLAEDVDVP